MGQEQRLELGTFTEVRNGVPLTYTISTIPPHLAEVAIKHMCDFFLPREPMCAYHCIHEHPPSLKAIQNIWKDIIAGGAALVAVREGPEDETERVIGANMTFVTAKNSPAPEGIEGTKVEGMYEGVAEIAHRAKVYETYGVDKYLSAFGLSVDKAYHGYKVGQRLLEAREPLCKELGIKVTATVFTAPESKHISKKVGFVVLYEDEHSNFEHNGMHTFKGVPGTFEQSAWLFT